jgi:hypothetical protein
MKHASRLTLMLTREENKSVQQKKKEKNTEGEEQEKTKIHYVSDRNHWVRKNDLSYSRSSDLRIDTGRVKKKAKKCIKVKQINKRREKKNKDTFFFAFTFYQTRSG